MQKTTRRQIWLSSAGKLAGALDLSGVVIEHLPYAAFIARYDRPATLFYLDPPYYGCEDWYGRDLFAREDFVRIAEILAGIKGKFLLSLGDHPEVRRIFAGFEMQELEVTYTVSLKAPKSKGKELLISAP